MITELTQITMAQYVDIVCGNLDIIEAPNKAKAEEVRTRLIYDFASIAEPTSAAIHIGRRRNETSEKSTYLFFFILAKLMSLGHIEDVRDLLSEYGVNAKNMPPEHMIRDIEARLLRAKVSIDKMNVEVKDKGVTPELSTSEIRLSFDRQAASIMTYFKFQIDFNTIKASTFACMIDLAYREIRAKSRALSKH